MTALYQIANDFAKLTDADMDPELIADIGRFGHVRND